MLRQIRQQLRLARRMHWGLGILETPIADVIAGKRLLVKLIKNPYKDRWFADPFILDFNDDIIEVLVEEYRYSVGRGRIARLNIDRKTLCITDFKIVLDLATHLSFPFILRDNDKVYIMPENFESGGQTIYEYERESDTIKKNGVIYHGELTDASIFESGARKFVLSTEVPGHNGNELKIFELNNGSLSCLKSVRFKDNVARNAGAVFTIGNKFYRPAQICNNGYGEGIEIQEIKIDRETLEPIKFIPVIRLKSTLWAYSEGFHTLNSWRGMTIIDVHGYRKPLLGKAIEYVASVVRQLKKSI